jgi:Mce-associated membrane protein
VVQDRAALEAEAAAEKMVGPVLSYNYQTMAEDLERIRGNMTEKMGEKQAAAWPELTEEAEAQQIVVEAVPTGTALTRVSPEGDRATVVVFIDQQVQKQRAQPFVLRMWATMSLVKASGSEGRWLLDDICTDDSCG